MGWGRGSGEQTAATGTELSHFNYSYARWILFLPFFSIKIRREGGGLTTVSEMGGSRGKGRKNRNQTPYLYPSPALETPDPLMGAGRRDQRCLLGTGRAESKKQGKLARKGRGRQEQGARGRGRRQKRVLTFCEGYKKSSRLRGHPTI